MVDEHDEHDDSDLTDAEVEALGGVAPDRASTKPATAAEMELSLETLDELLTAWAVCVGATTPPPGATPPDAMGLILTYLPAVLGLARKQVDREGQITTSAHEVRRTAQ